MNILKNKSKLYMAAKILCLAIIFLPLSIISLVSRINNAEPTRISLADFKPAECDKAWLNLPGGEYLPDQLRAYYFQDKLARLSMPYVIPGKAGSPAVVIAEISDEKVLERFHGSAKTDGSVTGTAEEKMKLLGLKQGELEGWRRPLDIVGKQFKIGPDAVSVTVGMGPDSPWLCLGGLIAGLIALTASSWLFYKALTTK